MLGINAPQSNRPDGTLECGRRVAALCQPSVNNRPRKAATCRRTPWYHSTHPSAGDLRTASSAASTSSIRSTESQKNPARELQPTGQQAQPYFGVRATRRRFMPAQCNQPAPQSGDMSTHSMVSSGPFSLNGADRSSSAPSRSELQRFALRDAAFHGVRGQVTALYQPSRANGLRKAATRRRTPWCHPVH